MLAMPRGTPTNPCSPVFAAIRQHKAARGSVSGGMRGRFSQRLCVGRHMGPPEADLDGRRWAECTYERRLIRSMGAVRLSAATIC